MNFFKNLDPNLAAMTIAEYEKRIKQDMEDVMWKVGNQSSILEQAADNPKMRHFMKLHLCCTNNLPARINGLLYKVTQVEDIKITHEHERHEYKCTSTFQFFKWTEEYDECDVIDIDSTLL